MDVDIKNAIQRRSGGEDDRMESAGVDFMSKVRGGYIKLCTKFTDRINFLDSTQDKNTIFNKITKQLCSIYGELNE